MWSLWSTSRKRGRSRTTSPASHRHSNDEHLADTQPCDPEDACSRDDMVQPSAKRVCIRESPPSSSLDMNGFEIPTPTAEQYANLLQRIESLEVMQGSILARLDKADDRHRPQNNMAAGVEKLHVPPRQHRKRILTPTLRSAGHPATPLGLRLNSERPGEWLSDWNMVNDEEEDGKQMKHGTQEKDNTDLEDHQDNTDDGYDMEM